VHQGCKLPDEELEDFFGWLYDLEYGKMGLPKPDMVIYLDVDVETSLNRMALRQQSTNTKADIHEQDAEYLQRCLVTARRAAKFYGWKTIDYMKNGVERTPEEKSQEIFEIILEELNK
jgi:dTMP kinase